MLKKLRIQFVAVMMVLVTVLLCLLFGMLYAFTKSNLEAESVRMMQAAANGPPQPGRPGLAAEEVQLPYFILQSGPGDEWIAVGAGYYDLSDEAFLRTLRDTALAQPQQTGALAQYNLRFYKFSTPLGQGLVFADTSSEQATLASLLRTCIFLGALCLAAFFGVSVLLAFWMVRPVERAWRQQRQFVADASHELKTPLTVILSNAELLQQPECGATDRACYTGRILTMSRQMRGLVERLLELARADSEPRQAAAERIDFSALVQCAALPFEAVFFEKGLCLRVQCEAQLFVQGDAQRLQQALEILLDNAQKYALPPGDVALTLRREDARHCVLSVSNACEPLSKEQLQSLFKRFYRLDAARSRDGSFGLGLSIAQSIAEAHRGRIWAEWRGGRIYFLLRLPLDEPRGRHPAGSSKAGHG